MPRGDKSKYTDKQERKADHIAESYETRGVPEQEAERRAWATVNKDDGGGKRSGGSGQGQRTGHPAAHKGGQIGGAHAAARPALAADRPTVIEFKTDAEVPPLPPHITPKQAKAFASSLIKGDPQEGSVILGTARQVLASVLPGKSGK
jgi:plasmid stabilization system protein ParE